MSRLMGINAASEGLVRGLARHGTVDPLAALVSDPGDAPPFIDAVRAANPARAIRIIPRRALDQVAELGALIAAGPLLAAHAWQRQSLGAAAYSIIGITHTTATPRVMDGLTALPTAPVEPWDAIICTSTAVRRMVEQLMTDQEAFLADRLGPTLALRRPQLPVISLGIDCDALIPSPSLRAQCRARFGIAPDDVVALYLGRLDHTEKAHPIPLFQAMTLAANQTKARLFLVMAGWFATPETEAGFRAAARDICPTTPVMFMDARLPDVRSAARAIADLFVSPVDNVQETFGLSPVEAMAAGLPAIVSDWNGYRDTVRDGVDGYLIPTLAPAPGQCTHLALQFSEGGLDGYTAQMAAISQHVAVDVAALAAAIARLAADPGLRQSMSKAAHAHARQNFDWSAIIPQHEALWSSLAELRPATSTPGPYPARPDPFRAFQSYPSAPLTSTCRLHRTPRSTQDLPTLLASPLVTPPPLDDLRRILQAANGATLSEIIRTWPPDHHADAYRAILWLAKYDFLALAR